MEPPYHGQVREYPPWELLQDIARWYQNTLIAATVGVYQLVILYGAIMHLYVAVKVSHAPGI